MVKHYLSKSAAQTRNFAENLAKKILKKKAKKKALIIALSGDLGGGKTTFVQGLAKGLGVKDKILSPTFVVMRRFKMNAVSFKNFYHVDCYRIKNTKDILALKFRKLVGSPQNIIAIEWPERVAKILPNYGVKIKFKFANKNTRNIALTSRISI